MTYPEDAGDRIVSMKTIIKELEQRVKDLEEQLAILMDKFALHSHPYRPEPRYGGRSL